MNQCSACIPGSARRALSAITILTALAIMGVSASQAEAATPPAVSTEQALAVSFASATLEGSVDPRGSDTSYYFQYGLTKGYGGQTLIANAGAGQRSVSVSAAVTGLQPLTEYHFRVVGVNAAGAEQGADHTFITTKVPLSLGIIASPDPVLFGGEATIQGTLSGTENAGRPVIAQASVFPFTAGFQTLALNPELTSSTGSFLFRVPDLVGATQFRVVTSTNPPIISPVAQVSVAARVSAHIGRSNRRHHARIFGTVSPAIAAEVGILRVSHGRNVLVAGTVLRPDTPTTSSFSRVVPISRGIYRVLVRVTNGAQISNYSGPLLIR